MPAIPLAFTVWSALCFLCSNSMGIASAHSFLEYAAMAREGREEVLGGNTGFQRERSMSGPPTEVPEYLRIAESVRTKTAPPESRPKGTSGFKKIAESARKGSEPSPWNTVLPSLAFNNERRTGSNSLSKPILENVEGNKAEIVDGVALTSSYKEESEEDPDYIDPDRIFFEDWDAATLWPEEEEYNDEIDGVIPLAIFTGKHMRTAASLATPHVLKKTNQMFRRQKRSDNHRNMVEGRSIRIVVDNRNRPRPRSL